jgi:hypothetical protein
LITKPSVLTSGDEVIGCDVVCRVVHMQFFTFVVEFDALLRALDAVAITSHFPKAFTFSKSVHACNLFDMAKKLLILCLRLFFCW